MRKRIAAAFDRFIDVEALGDFEVAKLLRELEIDIIIDLNGNSGDCRTEIFSYRPAPIQVNFLGCPGTTGLPFFDYIIADPVVDSGGASNLLHRAGYLFAAYIYAE